MANDEITPELAPLGQLRRERYGLRSQLGEGPPDPSWEYRRLSVALAREKYGRQVGSLAQPRRDESRSTRDRDARSGAWGPPPASRIRHCEIVLGLDLKRGRQSHPTR